MASCEKVHDWIERKGFESTEDAKAYVKYHGFPTYDDNPNLYDCIDLYDFEFEFVLFWHHVGRGPHKGRRYQQLHKRNRITKRFAKMGLDFAALAQINEFLRSGR